MPKHVSARPRQETPHATSSTKNVTGRAKKKTLSLNDKTQDTLGESQKGLDTIQNTVDQAKNTISEAIKRRAQYLINDTSIDAQSRALIRYALEINDPWLPELVRRADAGESIIDMDFSKASTVRQTDAISEHDATDKKVEALTEIICRAGDEPGTKSAALLVLMATLENAAHPKALANTAKHLAFTRCGELNLDGIVDAGIAVIENALIAAPS